jgi:hypothetical protein
MAHEPLSRRSAFIPFNQAHSRVLIDVEAKSLKMLAPSQTTCVGCDQQSGRRRVELRHHLKYEVTINQGEFDEYTY